MFNREFFVAAEFKYRRDFRRALAVAAAFASIAGCVTGVFGLTGIFGIIPTVMWATIATAAMHDAEEMADCVRRWDEGER